ncbi:hypothetical protein [Kitasatospora purpeofusca]|uniref:hypothetical protein n=1 Tax=Kitasatospora purpeofusca TaxID=67352 RepID=UPI002A5B0AB8|nr:hypothetical protein [Kitasatospora purpeofusca]MDY0812998.1 hypothetical protein [Kitasatospora purpeofusca]
MSGDRNNVHMYGGTGNSGVVYNQAQAAGGQGGSVELTAAVTELVRLLHELRSGVAPLAAQSIDEALPAIGMGPAAAPQDRHRALMAVAGIAATVGAVGTPVVEAVQRVLALLGGQ